MASLRAGCLPLAVETGRYRTPKVPLGERVCKLCNDGKVETEFHFVTECNKLQNLRNELFFIITKSDPSFMHLDIQFDKLGGGNTIPCNWKEIYRGYELSATCIQHSKCTCT